MHFLYIKRNLIYQSFFIVPIKTIGIKRHHCLQKAIYCDSPCFCARFNFLHRCINQRIRSRRGICQDSQLQMIYLCLSYCNLQIAAISYVVLYFWNFLLNERGKSKEQRVFLPYRCIINKTQSIIERRQGRHSVFKNSSRK